MTDADLDKLLEPHSPAIREVFATVRSLVRDVMPDAAEQVDLPDRVLAFGFGPRAAVRMRGLRSRLFRTRHVNVQLADGAELPDPTGIVEGTSKRIRHVKVRSVDDVARPALRRCARGRPRVGGLPDGPAPLARPMRPAIHGPGHPDHHQRLGEADVAGAHARAGGLQQRRQQRRRQSGVLGAAVPRPLDLAVLAKIRVGALQPVLARRAEDVHVERVLQSHRPVGHPAGITSTSRVHDDIGSVVRELHSEAALEDVGELLWVVSIGTTLPCFRKTCASMACSPVTIRRSIWLISSSRGMSSHRWCDGLTEAMVRILACVAWALR